MNNTPTYHIELVIAGAGTFFAILLTSFGIWGIWFPVGDYVGTDTGAGTVISLVVLLTPFFYSIGIVTDRMADLLITTLWGRKIIAKHFANESRPPGEAYLYARSVIYLRSSSLKEIFEYSRMRIRICRAWAFNSVLIFIAGLIFLLPAGQHQFFGSQNLTVLFFFSILNLTSAIFTFFGWKVLTEKECQNLKFQLKIVEAHFPL